MISVLDIVHDTMVDGPGFRTSVYCAGCSHACPGCHNPQSWDMEAGHRLSTDDIMREIISDPFANVTFTGGDPMFQAVGFLDLAKAIRRETDKNIWCFTGFRFEQLVAKAEQRALLEHVDVLMDGPFILSLRNPDLLFRGSSNQRAILVGEALRQGRVVELSDEDILSM